MGWGENFQLRGIFRSLNIVPASVFQFQGVDASLHGYSSGFKECLRGPHKASPYLKTSMYGVPIRLL